MLQFFQYELCRSQHHVTIGKGGTQICEAEPPPFLVQCDCHTVWQCTVEHMPSVTYFADSILSWSVAQSGAFLYWIYKLFFTLSVWHVYWFECQIIQDESHFIVMRDLSMYWSCLLALWSAFRHLSWSGILGYGCCWLAFVYLFPLHDFGIRMSNLNLEMSLC